MHIERKEEDISKKTKESKSVTEYIQKLNKPKTPGEQKEEVKQVEVKVVPMPEGIYT